MLIKYLSLISLFNFILLFIVSRVKHHPIKQSNDMLSVLLLLMAIYSGLIFFHYTVLISGAYDYFRYYAPIDGIFLLLMGPCLYYYIRSILGKPVQFGFRSLWHLVPMLPCTIFNVGFATWPYYRRINWLIKDFHTGTLEMNLLNVLLYVQIITYLVMCYSLLKKQLSISDLVTVNNCRVDVSWLKHFLLLNIGIMLLSAPFCFYIGNERTSIIIGQGAMDILFLYLFFRTSLNKDTFTTVTEQLAPVNDDSVFKITDTMASDYLAMLTHYMQDSKPYLNEDCCVQIISEEMGIPEHHLSIILNTRLKKTFPDFINEYRVEEAKQMLLSDKHEFSKIEAIGHDCGFGSKSSFNRVFKKHTCNLTPSEFRRQRKQ